MGLGSGAAAGRAGVARGRVTGVTPCATVTVTLTEILARARYFWSPAVQWLAATAVVAAAARAAQMCSG